MARNILSPEETFTFDVNKLIAISIVVDKVEGQEAYSVKLWLEKAGTLMLEPFDSYDKAREQYDWIIDEWLSKDE